MMNDQQDSGSDESDAVLHVSRNFLSSSFWQQTQERQPRPGHQLRVEQTNSIQDAVQSPVPATRKTTQIGR